jgi:alpha-beta hydrolase superfamily lysophospholipase
MTVPLDFDRRSLLGAAGGWALLGASAQAQTPVPVSSAPLIPTAVRRRRITVRGRTLDYQIETGERPMRNAAGALRATIFSVSYLETGAESARRPVSFIWNGGPGGATWHLREHLSPRITARAHTARGYAFVDNPDSPIDVSDLVFIDAPGTGYSRFLSEDAKPEYWGVEADGQAFADFIAGWLADHGRQASPVFLIGESYGGTRSGQIAKRLAGRAQPVGLTGVVLISPTLGAGSPPGPPHPVAVLPSLAATAHFHRKGAHTGKSLDALVREAERFADGPYAEALAADATLPADRREAVAAEVARLIGLPPAVVLESGLAPSVQQFRNQLLPGRRLGGGDARQHRVPPPPGQDSVLSVADGYDLGESIVKLLTDELGYTPAGPYWRDPVEANRRWDQTLTGPGYAPAIFKGLTAPAPKIFLVTGYYDLIVPYRTPLAALSAAGFAPGQFEARTYPVGHGVYEDLATRPKSTDDLRDFYRRALS